MSVLCDGPLHKQFKGMSLYEHKTPRCHRQPFHFNCTDYGARFQSCFLFHCLFKSSATVITHSLSPSFVHPCYSSAMKSQFIFFTPSSTRSRDAFHLLTGKCPNGKCRSAYRHLEIHHPRREREKRCILKRLSQTWTYQEISCFN